MRTLYSTMVALGLACTLAAGCDFLNKDKTSTSPTSPTATVKLDTFAGTWGSATASTPATGCGNVTYTVTPLNATSANVVFAGTCGGNIGVNGSGTGKLNGSSLDWNANGLVSQGGVNCPFTFTNGKAVEDGSGGIQVTYSGTVCGIPVSGTETVKKR